MLKYIFINLCLLNLIINISCDSVPCFIKGAKINLEPQNDIKGEQIGDKLVEYVFESKDKPNVYYVTQSVLSMEDLSIEGPLNKASLQNVKSFLEEAVIYPTVSNPTDIFQSLKSKFNFKALNSNSNSFGDDLAKTRYGYISVDCNAGPANCLKLVDGIFEKIEKFLGGKDFVVIWTGDISSYNSQTMKSGRHLLAEETDKSNTTTWSINNQTLIHIRKFNNETVKINDIGGTGDENQFSVTLTLAKDEFLTLNFYNLNSTWKLANATANEKDLEVNVFPEIPSGWSYSCDKLVIPSKESNKSKSYVLEGFQIQPFGVKEGKFSDSFHCQPFFTIPVWMGIFVLLTFSIILAIGIYGLFSINTMDRFDDAKSKPLSIPAE